MTERTITLTADDVERIAAEAVRKTLLTLGVDISKPESVVQAQADFQFLRSWREARSKFVGAGIGAGAILLVTGLGALVWAAIKNN